MTDHHAEYEAAARRKSADAMVADVRHMRDRYRLAHHVCFMRWERAMGDGNVDEGRHQLRRGADYVARLQALDGLLRKWGQGDE